MVCFVCFAIVCLANLGLRWREAVAWVHQGQHEQRVHPAPEDGGAWQGCGKARVLHVGVSCCVCRWTAPAATHLFCECRLIHPPHVPALGGVYSRRSGRRPSARQRRQRRLPPPPPRRQPRRLPCRHLRGPLVRRGQRQCLAPMPVFTTRAQMATSNGRAWAAGRRRQQRQACPPPLCPLGRCRRRRRGHAAQTSCRSRCRCRRRVSAPSKRRWVLGQGVI